MPRPGQPEKRAQKKKDAKLLALAQAEAARIQAEYDASLLAGPSNDAKNDDGEDEDDNDDDDGEWGIGEDDYQDQENLGEEWDEFGNEAHQEPYDEEQFDHQNESGYYYDGEPVAEDQPAEYADDSKRVAAEYDSFLKKRKPPPTGDTINHRSGKRRKGKEEKIQYQVLPVAELPENWNGEVEDGATYLALAAANKDLPMYTRAENPYVDNQALSVLHASGADGHDPSERASYLTLHATIPEADEAGSSRTRHPALFKEPWSVLFPLHFNDYRQKVSLSWPPSPTLPYPTGWPLMPAAYQRFEWGHFINGHPRKRRRKGDTIPAAGASSGSKDANGKVELPTSGGTTSGDDGPDEGETEVEMEEEKVVEVEDEEAAMNAAPAKKEEEEWELEPVQEKHLPREPMVSALQKLDSKQIIQILGNLAFQIQHTLIPLEAELVIPTTLDAAVVGSRQQHTQKNPFSERYSRWIFALLLVLDKFLLPEQVSVLRDLARVVARVGGWRWVVAVTTGEVGLPSGSTDADSFQAGDAVANGSTPIPWVFGARWKYARDRRDTTTITTEEMGKPAKEQIPLRNRPEWDETGVDETLARCWLIVHAVASGWGQRDLIDDLEEMFS